jgi:hypothetical protein
MSLGRRHKSTMVWLVLLGALKKTNENTKKIDEMTAKLDSYSVKLDSCLAENNDGVHFSEQPQIVQSPPSQPKAPDHPLHHVENPSPQNIPHHHIVKAPPESTSKSEQNGLHHQYSSQRGLLFEKTHKLHHVPPQFFAQIMTLADKTTVKMEIQPRHKLKRLAEEEVNPPPGRPPRKRIKRQFSDVGP